MGLDKANWDNMEINNIEDTDIEIADVEDTDAETADSEVRDAEAVANEAASMGISGAFFELTKRLGTGCVRSELEKNDLIENNKIASEKLLHRLQELKLWGEEGYSEDWNKMCKILPVVTLRLEEMPVEEEFETYPIDGVLTKVCDHLQSAYESGRVAAACYLIKTLVYGIMIARKPVALGEEENKTLSTIMEERENALNMYLITSQFALNVELWGEFDESVEEQLAQNKRTLRDEMDAVEVYKRAHVPVEEHLEIVAKGKPPWPENILLNEVMELSTLMKKAVATFKEGKKLEQQKAEYEKLRDQEIAHVYSMQLRLDETDECYKNELIDSLYRMGSEALMRCQKVFQELQDEEATFSDYIDSVLFFYNTFISEDEEWKELVEEFGASLVDTDLFQRVALILQKCHKTTDMLPSLEKELADLHSAEDCDIDDTSLDDLLRWLEESFPETAEGEEGVKTPKDETKAEDVDLDALIESIG